VGADVGAGRVVSAALSWGDRLESDAEAGQVGPQASDATARGRLDPLTGARTENRHGRRMDRAHTRLRAARSIYFHATARRERRPALGGPAKYLLKTFVALGGTSPTGHSDLYSLELAGNTRRAA
jgi:hypothetical protein